MLQKIKRPFPQRGVRSISPDHEVVKGFATAFPPDDPVFWYLGRIQNVKIQSLKTSKGKSIGHIINRPVKRLGNIYRMNSLNGGGVL